MAFREVVVPRFVRVLALRILAVVVLFSATPGVTSIVEEALSLAIGAECCDDSCCDDGFGCSPTTCSHCKCVTQATTAPVATRLEPDDGPARVSAFGSRPDRPYASGFRAPPFRPPAG